MEPRVRAGPSPVGPVREMIVRNLSDEQLAQARLECVRLGIRGGIHLAVALEQQRRRLDHQLKAT